MAQNTVRPVHDTPLGKVHPYWARKPFNIVRAIVEELSNDGELIADPFMGSGTIPFAALAAGRDAIGGDLSPLSVFLVRALDQFSEQAGVLLPLLQELMAEFREVVLPKLQLRDGSTVERIRYEVSGSYVNGAFTLNPCEVITKWCVNGRWRQRRSVPVEVLNELPNIPLEEVSTPIRFEDYPLKPNSRIAIPEGATLADYFTPVNQWAINRYVELVQESPYYSDYREALLLPISAALPMLRLSDKKASSQWPYWRPRRDLTTRNPVMVLEKKYEAIVDFVDWVKETLSIDSTRGQASMEVLHVAAQELKEQIPNRRVNLVLTDPPYGDQVPYLEYSNLWAPLLGLSITENESDRELVVSSARPGIKEAQTYQDILADCLQSCVGLLSDRGYVAWFYQDHKLANWSRLYTVVHSLGARIVGVLPMPKQRRSLKTVTTPNRTLDGDLLLIIAVGDVPEAETKVQSLRERIAGLTHENTYFGRYAEILTRALLSGDIVHLAAQYDTVDKVMSRKDL